MSRVGERAERLISPEQQAERIEGYAQARGLTVTMLDPELDVSGAKNSRPILDRIIGGVESGEYEGVIVAQLDRLSRMSMVDALHTIERIEGIGGKVIAVAENFDEGTPEGRAMRNVILTFNRMQWERYAAQFENAKKQAVDRGIWPISRVPIGYRKGADRTLIPSKDAPKVVRAFELRASGVPWRKVGSTIDRGITGTQSVIRNRVYLGEIHYGPWVNLNAHEPLVDRALWEAAQITHPRPPRGKAGPALLAGLVRCASCQCIMSPEANQYRCFPYKAAGTCPAPALISRRILEPYVEEVVLSHLATLQFRGNPLSNSLQEATEALALAERELSAFQLATQVTEVGPETFAEGLRVRIETVETRRADVVAARGSSKHTLEGDAVSLWPDLSIIERRHVLRSALGAIWVRKGRGIEGRVKIVENVPRDLPKPGGGRFPIVPVDWENIPGVIGVAGA